MSSHAIRSGASPLCAIQRGAERDTAPQAAVLSRTELGRELAAHHEQSLGWDMAEAAKELARLLGEEKVDPEPTLAVATRVMELEVQVKRAHMRLLIELKNQLDSDQQRTLRRLRE